MLSSQNPIVLLALGSRGDVLPYLALARGLHAAGYPVRFATNEPYEAEIRAAGLDFFPLGDDSRAFYQSAEWQAVQADGSRLALLRFYARATSRLIEEPQRRSWEAVQGCGALLFSTTIPWGCHLAERLGVPAIQLAPSPLAPSRHYPAQFLVRLAPRQPWPLLNVASHSIFDRFVRLVLDPLTNRFRRRTLGLPPRRFWQSRCADPTIPDLYGYSPLVGPNPPDWPSTVHVTGYWFDDTDTEWQPPEELLHFLAAGERPLFVGFSSIVQSDAEARAMHDTVLAALRGSGQRAVWVRGWGAEVPNDDPARLFTLPFAPYRWLLPRLSMAIHHAGAGTTGEVARAGIPSIPIPFTADNPFWARRLEALGVAHPALYPKNLSAVALADAITAVSRDEAMHERAAALGERVQAEDGVARAVALVQRYVGPPPT